MKHAAPDPSASSLSVRARDSSLPAFLTRVSLSVLALPLAGYALGSLADQRRSGDISWAIAAALLGLTAGLVHLWMWMKRPSPSPGSE